MWLCDPVWPMALGGSDVMSRVDPGNSPVLLDVPSLSLPVSHIWRTGGVSEPQGMVEPLGGRNRHTHTHTHTHLHMQAHHTCTHTNTDMHTCTHITRVCLHANVCTHIHSHIYAYTQIHTSHVNTCMHAHTYIPLPTCTNIRSQKHTHTPVITAPPPSDLDMSRKQPPCVQPWGRGCGPQCLPLPHRQLGLGRHRPQTPTREEPSLLSCFPGIALRLWPEAERVELGGFCPSQLHLVLYPSFKLNSYLVHQVYLFSLFTGSLFMYLKGKCTLCTWPSSRAHFPGALYWSRGQWNQIPEEGPKGHRSGGHTSENRGVRRAGSW